MNKTKRARADSVFLNPYNLKRKAWDQAPACLTSLSHRFNRRCCLFFLKSKTNKQRPRLRLLGLQIIHQAKFLSHRPLRLGRSLVALTIHLKSQRKSLLKLILRFSRYHIILHRSQQQTHQTKWHLVLGKDSGTRLMLVQSHSRELQRHTQCNNLPLQLPHPLLPTRNLKLFLYNCHPKKNRKISASQW